MKNSIKVQIIFLTLFWALNSFASENPDRILEKVRDRYDGADYVSNVILRLIDAGGGVRERKIYMLQKDMNDKEIIMLLFHDPSDVRGVNFMIATHPEISDKADDQWMYFPAFRKIRRIASQDKRGSFMGSTFAYTDLDKLRVSEFTSSLIGEENIDGRPAWVIERVSVSQKVINKTGYYRTRFYVDKERDILLKQEYYDIKGIKFKEQRSTKVELIENIWTITEAVMKNNVNGRTAVMIFNDMDYNVGLKDRLFSRRVLERGISSADVPQLTGQ